MPRPFDLIAQARAKDPQLEAGSCIPSDHLFRLTRVLDLTGPNVRPIRTAPREAKLYGPTSPRIAEGP